MEDRKVEIKEITEDPLAVAVDVVAYVTGCNGLTKEYKEE